jgi:predicted DNA-binding antitoxin AbrB/MazE fold protein
MSVTVEATFENGQLKLKEPVIFAEGTPVRVTITAVDEHHDPLAGLIGICSGGPPDGAEHHDKYIYDAEFAARRRNRIEPDKREQKS